MTDSGAKIYVVISQTGTILSRLLKLFTRDEYNHSSVALDGDLKRMYSFGRMWAYYPFYGGFVTESPDFGTFKRFKNTRAVVLSFDVTYENWHKIRKKINAMLESPKSYKYNYFGVYFAAVNIVHRSKNKYYCSEFVRDILIEAGVDEAKALPDIIKPVQFIDMSDSNKVYCGKLCDYEEFYNKEIAFMGERM